MNVDIKEPLKDLRLFHKRVKDNLKPISQIAEMEPSLDKLSDLREVIDKTISAQLVSSDISELLSKLRSDVSKIMDQSASAFGQIEAGFINYVKQQDLTWKELDTGWRVGSLELRFRRPSSAVAIFYNHEIVLDWTYVSSVEQLRKLYEDALTKVDSFVMDKKVRDQVFTEAFDFLVWKRQASKTANPAMVPIKDFFREVSVAKYRAAMSAKKKDEPLNMVAFLRNLDEYIRDISAAEGVRRLAFQSGSQAEQSKGIGVTIGGLNAKSDYRTVCFVVVQRSDNGVQ